MRDSPDSTKAIRVVSGNWRERHSLYRCVDSIEIPIKSRAAEYMFREIVEIESSNSSAEPLNDFTVSAFSNGVIYQKLEEDLQRQPTALISNTMFSRAMHDILRGAQGTRVIIFPNTVSDIKAGAFY